MKKKYLLIIILAFVLFTLFGCLNKKCELKITDTSYDKETYELKITVSLDEKLKEKNIVKYGLVYEFTSTDKISNLTLDREGLYKIEIETKDLDSSSNTILFVIEEVGKYMSINSISARPYAIESNNDKEESILSNYYKVIEIDAGSGQTTPPVDDPIITEVNFILNFKTTYSVRTEDNRYTVRYQTTKNYDFLYIYITAKEGYEFSEDVVINFVEENGKDIGRYTTKLTNNNKEIEFKMRDPFWTGIY